MSLFRWQPGLERQFVGLRNFRRVLNDHIFWTSWRNTLWIGLWRFTIPFAIPLLVAEAIFNLRSVRAKAVYRVAIVVPTLVPGIVILMLWKWLYVYDGGINLLLEAAGLGHLARPWLGTKSTALPAVLFMGFPWIIGTAPLIYLAGLMGISSDVLDAAKIDGCSTWRRIVTIDLPSVIGQIRLFLIFGIVDLLQDFGSLLALTQGGPSHATEVPGLYLYRKAFGIGRFEQGGGKRMGEASAVGVMLFVLILVLSLLSHRYLRVSGVSEVE